MQVCFIIYCYPQYGAKLVKPGFSLFVSVITYRISERLLLHTYFTAQHLPAYQSLRTSLPLNLLTLSIYRNLYTHIQGYNYF
jgi:hypothetical protein